MSHSDFYGNPVAKESQQFCHHSLNRCVADPYQEITNKLPGEMCINNYECLSNSCYIPSGKDAPECVGKSLGYSCLNDTECNVGLFCNHNEQAKKSTCEKQVPIDSKCNKDEQCLNHLACSNQKCVRYGREFNG